MKQVAVCQAPFWSPEFVPLNLAVLGAALRAGGAEPRLLDLNRALWETASAESRRRWLSPAAWWDDEFVAQVLAEGVAVLDCLDIGDTAMLWTVSGPQGACTRAILAALRARGACGSVWVGGPDVILAGAEAWREDADVVGVGELEPLVAALLGAARGLLSGGAADIDALELPAFDLLDMERYPGSNRLSYMASRGCRNRCAFCSECMVFPRLRYRRADLVGADLRALIANHPGVQGIRLQDSALNSDHDRFLALLSPIASAGRMWGANLIAAPELDDDVCARLAASGCVFVSMGLEAASDELLAKMGKGTKLASFSTLVHRLAARSIHVSVNLMPGFPGETESMHLGTVAWIREHAGALHSLTISPTGVNVAAGSRLARRSREDGVDEAVRRRRALEIAHTALDLGVAIALPGGPVIATHDRAEALARFDGAQA